MKLKYYLRGLGLGIVLTAILMGVVLGRRTSKMSDEEVIKRAKQLGMVEAESTLSSYSETAKSPEVTDETNNTTPDTEVDQKGEEVSEEVHEAESSAAESVSEMDEASQESGETGENSESIESEEDVKLASNDAAETASTDVVGTEEKTEAAKEEQPDTKVNEAQTSDTKTTLEDTTTDNSAAQASTEETASTETAPQEAAAAPATADSSDVSYVVVVLPSGSESDTCARILRESGVIEDGVAFNKYLVSSGQDRKIRSGTKQIPRGASFEEIASIITK